MMKLLPSLTLVFLSALAVRADVVIEQKVESAMLNGSMVLKIRGDQARMDSPSLGGTMTVLWNFKTGQMTTLMSAQKMAMKGSINSKPGGGEQPQLKATGVTEKVGPYTAEVYEVTSGPTTSKLWVARDYPNADVLKAELKKMSGGGNGGPGGFNAATLDVPGMVVKSQITTPGGPVTVTLLSARQQPVPDSDFAIPAGYKEMGMNLGSLAAAAASGPHPATGAAPAVTAPVAPPPAALAPSAPKPAPAEAIAKMTNKAKRHWEGRFKELDTNGDGKLTLEEFLLGPMGKKTPEKAKIYFKGIDKGNRGAITLDEWIGAHSDEETGEDSGGPKGTPLPGLPPERRRQ